MSNEEIKELIEKMITEESPSLEEVLDEFKILKEINDKEENENDNN